MLLAVLPFIAASILYWISCNDLFEGSVDSVPGNWTARLFLPVLTGSLSALATGAGQEGAFAPFATVAALGILFTVVTAASYRDDATFFDLKLLVGLGKSHSFARLQRWHLLRAVGLLIMAYGCVISVVLAATRP